MTDEQNLPLNPAREYAARGINMVVARGINMVAFTVLLGGLRKSAFPKIDK